MANQDLRENVCLNLRSVTQSCKGGVPFERLQRDYRDLLGQPIPFRDLGFNSLEAFIRSIPDVIALKRSSDGQIMAIGVADASTAHIASLVSRQKADTRKRVSRKPSAYGAKKSYSSRYSFREGSRGAYSRFNSNPPTTGHPRSPKAKPSSPTPFQRSSPTPYQHSKPRAPVHQVPPRSRLEIAPRFLKQIRRDIQNDQASPTKSKSSFTFKEPIEEQRCETQQNSACVQKSPEQKSPTDSWSSSFEFTQPVQEVRAHNSSSVGDSLPVTLNSTSVIPPPQAPVRSLPLKPELIPRPEPIPRPVPRLESVSKSEVRHISRPETSNFSLEALNSARSAKEFVDIYAGMNSLTPEYKTTVFGQKGYTKGHVSTLYLNDKRYQTYPDRHETKELAEEAAAEKAMADIKSRKEHLGNLRQTPYSNLKEIRSLLNRIEEIVCEKPSGMFDNGLVREYEHKFNERLPSCWSELVKQSGCLEVEEVKIGFGKVPNGVNFIVLPRKEVSSGSQTPSSTSSKTESFLQLDSLKTSLVNFSLPEVPELKLPTGNVWDVYITNVNDSLSARIVDYYDDFLALANEMSEFYILRGFPIEKIEENQIYAACTEESPDIWHRVIVDEIQEKMVSCYFVDEGDVACVRKEYLQEMCPKFLKLPFQAVHLSLEGLEEYESYITTENLETYLLGKALIAEVKRCFPLPEFFPEFPSIDRTVYSVVLYDTSDSSGEDVNLNELLKTKTVESLICKLPKLSTTTCAYLSNVTNKGKLYLRLTNPEECFLEQQLQKLSPNFEEISQTLPEVPLNKLCAAKYETTWHRAIVSENQNNSLDPDMIEVFFVDYGQLGFVRKSEICELEPFSELLFSAPPQAISCELFNALPSPNHHWTESTSEKLLEMAPFNQELIVKVVNEEDENNLAKVHLYKRNANFEIISINESLSCNPTLFRFDMPTSERVKTPSLLPLKQNTAKSSLKSNLSGMIPDVAISAEEQMAKSKIQDIEWLTTPDNIKSPESFEVQPPIRLSLPDIPNEGEMFDVFVTMASHPHNFIVQPLSYSPTLDQLSRDMNAFYSVEDNLLEIDPSMLQKNGYYAALHQDGQWYRVRIEHIMNGNPVFVTVYYVDFGDYNTICMQKLQPLYQKFKHLPCQAIKASLAGIKPINKDWDPIHSVAFKNMVTEKVFVAIIYKKHTVVEKGVPTLNLEVSLCDTSTEKDYYIADRLVELNIAKHC